MKDKFLRYIDQISDSKSISLIAAQSVSGTTTLLLEIAKRNIQQGKKVLFLAGDAVSKSQLDGIIGDDKDNIFISFFNGDNSLFKDILEGDLANDFDIVIIDVINHFVESLIDTPRGIAEFSRTYGRVLRIFKEKGINLICSTHLMRNNHGNGINFRVGQNISYTCDDILIVERKANNIYIRQEKSRMHDKFKVKSKITIDEGRISILDNIQEDNSLFFGQELIYDKEYYVIEYLSSLLDKPLSEYLNGYSKRRQQRFEDILYLEKEISRDNINFYFLNTFEICKSYNDFNIDDFILTDDFKIRQSDNSLKINHSRSMEDLFVLFLSECINYKRAITLFKNFLKEDNPSGWSLLYAIGVNYNSILNKKRILSKIGLDKVYSNEIFKLINKAAFKKKNFADILVHLEEVLLKIETLEKENKEKIVTSKQSRFKKANDEFKKKGWTIQVPESLDDIIKGGEFFKNCTSGGFFLKDFIMDESVLFYLKGEKDYCVHIDGKGSLIEVKGISNSRLENIESKLIKNCLKKLKIK